MYATPSELFIPLVVLSIAAISYAALAITFARRRGRMILWPIWLLASVTATGALIARNVYTRSYVTVSGFFTGPFPGALLLLTSCALGFGAVSLLVARRHKSGNVSFGFGLAAGSVGACLLGVILFMLALGVVDWLTF